MTFKNFLRDTFNEQQIMATFSAREKHDENVAKSEDSLFLSPSQCLSVYLSFSLSLSASLSKKERKLRKVVAVFCLCVCVCVVRRS